MATHLYPIAENPAELQGLRRRLAETPVVARVDLLIALQNKEVVDTGGAAALLKVSKRTIRRWWMRYHKGGMPGLLGAKFRGILLQPDAVAGRLREDRTLAPYVVAMLNALPDKANPVEWIEQFRKALAALFSDIDRITINAGFAALPGGEDSGAPDLMAVNHVGKENRRGRSAIVTSSMPPLPSSQLVESMIRSGFPADLYRPPFLFDYHREDGTYLGTIILWGLLTSPVISEATLETFGALSPFFRFMFSDFVARQQAARPESKVFATRMAEIVREHGLTTREHEVLIHYVVGRRHREIAEHLSVSLSTVQKHIEAIHQKTKATTTAELVARFFAPIREGD